LDGGESWQLDGKSLWTLAKPSAVTSAREDALPLTEAMDFTHPDFALKSYANNFAVSYDRGRTWRGPYLYPDLGKRLTARTDYIVTGERSCLVFLAAFEPAVEASLQDRAFCIHTSDGGLSFQARGYITGEPITVRSVMPSTVRGSQEQLISALRRRHDRQEQGERIQSCWIDLYQSHDEGFTWEFLSKVANTGQHNGNPPALIRLRDGRLCVAYGVRRPPFGIRAKISNDEGQSWGEEIVLRDDGRTWDLGYPRMVQRSDGKLITIYYFTTAENPEQHIAASIWDPAEFSA
jgi:hypothetical protein